MAKGDATPTKGVMDLDIGTALRKLRDVVRKVSGKWLGGSVVTIDIDDAAIRLLETRGRVVKRWASVALEPGLVEGGVVSDRRALGLMVKQLMTSSGIKAGRTIASINGVYSISRLLPMSNPPAGSTFQEAVMEQAREALPLSEELLYLSWQTVVAGEAERQVLIVGVPREVIDGEMRSLRAVGINPRILELRTMALARAVAKEQAIILNIEPSSFDIVVVANGIPEIMRSIAWQQGDLTVEDKVEHLVVTLELTLDFYNSRHSDSPLDPATPFFITGQMSGDLTLVKSLQAWLRYPVETLAPPLELPEQLPVSQYAGNIGLALRGIATPVTVGEGGYLPLDMNLLPRVYHPWRPTARQIYATFLITAAVALIFPLFQVTSEAMDETSNLQVKFNVLNTRLELMKAEIKKREPLQKAIDNYHRLVDAGVSFTGDVELIRNEAERLGVRVASIAHVGDSIDISCEADEGDYITFRAYKTALEESGRFSTPVVPPEGYPYTWRGTIKVEPVEAKPGG